MISKAFPLPLVVRYIDGRMWELMQPFEYHRKNGGVIKVPPSFKFDFASIPKFLWSIIGSPTGRYGPAALIHDYCIGHAIWPRKKTDKIFLEALRDCGVPYLKRMLFYYAVRLWSFF